MDLGLDIVRTRGRAARPIMAEVARELNPADLGLLAAERGIKPLPIAKIKASHHALARCLATGCSAAEASMITGYSISRISILQRDPAFIDLIAVYNEAVAGNFEAGAEQMRTLRGAAVGELIERIDESPEKLDTKDLVDIMKATADRTGLGPATKSTNVNVNVELAPRLEAARRRAGMIEGVALPLIPSISREEPGA